MSFPSILFHRLLTRVDLRRKAPELKLTERLERIWNEYPNGLLDLTEAQLEQRPPDEPAVEETKVEVVDKERDPSSMMDWEEMEQLRSDIFLQLK